MQADQDLALTWAMAREMKGIGLMPIIATQSLCPSPLRTKICADLALAAAKRGERVLALDLCPDRQLTRRLIGGGFANIGDVRRLLKPASLAEKHVPYPASAVLSIGGSFGGNRAGNGSTDAEPLFADPIASQSALLTNLGSLRDKVDLCFIDCPPDPILQGLIAWMTIEVHFVDGPKPDADFVWWKQLVLDIFPTDLQPRVFVEQGQN